MISAIVLPGITGSGPEHWQSIWEAQDPSLFRFQPASWDYPDLDDWIASLDAAIATAAQPPLLIVHSLACLLVAHWSARSTRSIRGAFLVSVPDPKSPAFPAEARSFEEPPRQRFGFPALIVASSNDPFGTIDYSRSRAREWGAGYVIAGAYGHINGASGLGEWEQGKGLFEAFRAGTGAAGPGLHASTSPNEK
ncbi:alpha/beta hydrolase [Shinella sp.]|uniref:RBBP9/YdeN family alpha/beta hydrolase n=1 Tax=Shinella sp. TaxID=1870904 RepID=UPI002586C75A|nr:alpha/beta hydrolase [Shinella sp.]MCW5711970.1 alpha/beta hydrolase [Shinella sp.]